MSYIGREKEGYIIPSFFCGRVGRSLHNLKHVSSLECPELMYPHTLVSGIPN